MVKHQRIFSALASQSDPLDDLDEVVERLRAPTGFLT